MDPSKFFILVPAYNAGATVEKVFARIPAEIRPRVERYAAVDDGSTDDTAAALARLGREFPDLTILKHEKNRGYGAAIKTLLAYALAEGAEIAVVLHSDGQYSPEKLVDMTAPFANDGADLVQGSRMLGGGALRSGMPLYKYLANKGLTAVENAGFGLKMAEYHSGYMAYSRKLLQAVPFRELSDSFDIDLEMIVCAKILGLRIREIAIPTIYAGEKSHLNPIKYGFDVLSIVRKYRRGYYHALLKRRSDR